MAINRDFTGYPAAALFSFKMAEMRARFSLSEFGKLASLSVAIAVAAWAVGYLYLVKIAGSDFWLFRSQHAYSSGCDGSSPRLHND